MKEKPNINKIGGGSFKFLASHLPPEPISKVMPIDKRKCEFALTILFTQILIYNGASITKIELNENDENKGADTIIKLNGINKGIQITKLVMNNLLMRKNVGIKRSLKISELISENLEIDFKLNIVIHPANHNKNEIPKNKVNLDVALALKIKESILINLDSLKNTGETVIMPIEEENISQIASLVFIMPIKANNYSVFPGKNNIYVNYEFDNNFFTQEDVSSEIETIYNRKNNGDADFLLIWADKFDLLHQDKEIFALIEDKFSICSFEKVYFLTFHDRIDIFNQGINLRLVNSNKI